MFGPTGMMAQDIGWMLGQPDGLYTRYPFRCMALMYDWMYNDLTQTQRDQLKNAMLVIAYTLLNPTDSSAIYASVYGSNSLHGWSINNPYNNHFYQQRLGIAYAALSIFGAQPTTITWKAGAASGWTGAGVSTFNFRLPRYNSDSTITYYTDLWNWLKDQIETKMLPVLSAFDSVSPRHRDIQHGKNSVKHMLEMFSIIRQTAGIDYILPYWMARHYGVLAPPTAEPAAGDVRRK
jgi:hypothetical protein